MSVASLPGPLADVSVGRNLPAMRTPMTDVIEPAVAPGTRFDERFVVRELLSRSHRSSIYRAEDAAAGGRLVAIKFPLLSVESDPAGYARFRREEEIGLQLDHPGLLRFLPVPRKTGRPHFVTELLDGCTLADLLHAAGRLPERDALRIAAVACEAMAHLHALGFVHRDLKPANLVLGHDLTLRVIDFGEAAPPERKARLLAALTPIVGTPEYMAPEQVEHRPNDERTDIYSLGAVLYEMLTGVVPFQNADAWASAYQRTTGDPIAPRELVPGISPVAEEIVLHALQRDPAQRYPTAAAFLAELQAPERVAISGRAGRLRPPRWRLSLHGTPILAGVLIGAGAIAALVGLFIILTKLAPGR